MVDDSTSKKKFISERIAHWDEQAEQSMFGLTDYYHRCLEKTYKFRISPGLRVLEIGCGKGDLLASVQPSFGVGVDQSVKMIETAGGKSPGKEQVGTSVPLYHKTGRIREAPVAYRPR